MHTFLPEIVSDILLRLPVKSLLRFRCLSTSLCSEIDSPNFIKNHINKSIRSQIRQKLIVKNRNVTHFYTLHFDGLKGSPILNCPFKYPSATPLVIGGSCNGLILLVLDNTKLTLWNPFTRRYKNIPPCPFETLPGQETKHLLGLGHDSALDDYNIVMVSYFEDSGPFHLSFPSWIFSLKRNSWRRIQDAPAKLKNYKLSWKASFANGALYWRCDEDKIFAFDIRKEVFFNIPPSLDLGILINRRYTQQLHFCYDTMAIFKGKLYLAKITAESEPLEFHRYVTDEGGEEAQGSWKKEFEIEDGEIEWPLNEAGERYHRVLVWSVACSEDGDSILVYRKNKVFWYNPETKSRQRVTIWAIPSAQGEYNLNVCWESLVSLGNEGVFDAAPEPKISPTSTWVDIAQVIHAGLILAFLICFYLYYIFKLLFLLVYYLASLVNELLQ